jgi:hypothetical protein
LGEVLSAFQGEEVTFQWMDNVASVEQPKIPEVTVTIVETKDSKTLIARRERVENAKKALLGVRKAIVKTGLLTLDGEVDSKLAAESDKFLRVCLYFIRQSTLCLLSLYRYWRGALRRTSACDTGRHCSQSHSLTLRFHAQ